MTAALDTSLTARMTDFFLVAAVVAFFAAAALLVRALDRVVTGNIPDDAAPDDHDNAPAGEDHPWPARAADARRPAPVPDRRQ
jgi:hypothetical protein